MKEKDVIDVEYRIIGQEKPALDVKKTLRLTGLYILALMMTALVLFSFNSLNFSFKQLFLDVVLILANYKIMSRYEKSLFERWGYITCVSMVIILIINESKFLS